MFSLKKTNFLKKLANLQLAIGLLISIGFIIAIGTILEQDQSEDRSSFTIDFEDNCNSCMKREEDVKKT